MQFFQPKPSMSLTFVKCLNLLSIALPQDIFLLYFSEHREFIPTRDFPVDLNSITLQAGSYSLYSHILSQRIENDLTANFISPATGLIWKFFEIPKYMHSICWYFCAMTLISLKSCFLRFLEDPLVICRSFLMHGSSRRMTS